MNTEQRLTKVVSANKSHCKLITEKGRLRRIYVGDVSETEDGDPCYNWLNVSKNYSEYQGIGDHNFCRNPGKVKSREFCYKTETTTKYCKVRTCGGFAI